MRVVRAGWDDPLDVSFSQTRSDRRWNTIDFPTLYCCCSVQVARAITRDLLGIGSVLVADLQPAYRPALVDIKWQGRVADITSLEGLKAAGFEATYPEGVEISETQRRAVVWIDAELEGVVCRSASLHRLGFSDWLGSHEPWGELAIFVSSSSMAPELINRRVDLDWLHPSLDAPR